MYEVDQDDKVVKVVELEDCFRTGLLHRAVTVFLRNQSGEIFLQQRSASDDWMPSLWTASCTGHVRAEETGSEAARREVSEELGILVDPEFLYKLVLPRIECAGKIEWEIALVFEAWSDQPLRLDPNEVEGGKFLSISECKKFFEECSREITPDAILTFCKYSSLKQL